MATLHEIADSYRRVIESGFDYDEETGEILWDESDIDRLEGMVRDKVEACALWVKDQRALAKAMRDEERALADRRRAVEARADRIERYLADHLQELPSGRLETPRVSVRPQRSSAVRVVDESAVPDFLKRVKTEVSVDKSAVGRLLRAGRGVPGCELEDRTGVVIK